MKNEKSLSIIFNLIAFKIGWVSAVFGATKGLPWLGPLWILMWAISFLVWKRKLKTGWVLLVGAAIIGYILDSVMVLLNFIEFPPEVRFGAPSPFWMVAMWVNFAATLRYSLGWMRDRFILGAIIGLVLGPLAYIAGSGLGAIEITSGIFPIAIEWLIGIPLLLYLERISRAGTLQLRSKTTKKDSYRVKNT
jgi:hypothetical protein